MHCAFGDVPNVSDGTDVMYFHDAITSCRSAFTDSRYELMFRSKVVSGCCAFTATQLQLIPTTTTVCGPQSAPSS